MYFKKKREIWSTPASYILRNSVCNLYILSKRSQGRQQTLSRFALIPPLLSDGSGDPREPPPSQTAQRYGSHDPLILPTEKLRFLGFPSCGSNDLYVLAADLMKNPVDGFSAGLVDDSNIFEWSVTIIGPPDTL